MFFIVISRVQVSRLLPKTRSEEFVVMLSKITLTLIPLNDVNPSLYSNFPFIDTHSAGKQVTFHIMIKTAISF